MRRIFVLSLLPLSLTGCVERQLDGPESDLLPVCMLYPAKGYEPEDNGGDATLLLAPDGSTGRTCDCLTQHEFDEGLRLDEFHERALQECLQLAAPFESNDCQEMHDEGGWLLLMLPAVGDNAWLTVGKDLDCSEQADAGGCSATGDLSSPFGLLALLLLGLGSWRYQVRQFDAPAFEQRLEGPKLREHAASLPATIEEI